MIVNAEWLNTHLTDPLIRIVDVRSYLGDPNRGHREYEISHIPGAVFLDLEKDLAATKDEGHQDGGRHPLPDLASFVARLGGAGLTRQHHVVVYDQNHGAIAARLWWMLRHVGHEQVAVLDGGWPSWIGAGGPRTDIVPEFVPAAYVPEIRTDDLATRMDVADRASTTTLIDARATPRYLGEIEPIDPVAGHIPGAVNIPHESLARDGRMLSTDELADHLTGNADTIAYCGSGVTACYVILAHAVAGLPLPRLYVGSWSDWAGAGMPVAP